jgi:enoyl-CoA hydratase/3-hydroxyacyl-CoA dehydrogenase
MKEIKKVAVMGAGDMGHGIAQVALMKGYKVALRDIEQRFIDRGVQGIKDSLEKFFVAKQKISPEQRDEMLKRLKTTVSIEEAVKDADFVIEAVPEVMDIKKSVFKDLDKFAPKDAILATNTSNMSITEIAEATKRPDKVVGMHFFNPAVRMKLVEVTKGKKTSEDTMQVTYDFATKMDKAPVRVEKDSPSFIYNRVNAPVMLLLELILEKKTVSPEEFDAAFKAVLPMAPYELLDFVGIDVAYHSLKYLHDKLSPEYRSTALEQKVNAGNLGKKTGKGFYDWSAGRPTIDTSKATKEFGLNDLIALQVNEATKLLDEGVAKSAADIDNAIVNGGGGFGPFQLAKGIGYPELVKRCEALAQKFNVNVFKPTDTMKKGKIQV